MFEEGHGSTGVRILLKIFTNTSHQNILSVCLSIFHTFCFDVESRDLRSQSYCLLPWGIDVTVLSALQCQRARNRRHRGTRTRFCGKNFVLFRLDLVIFLRLRGRTSWPSFYNHLIYQASLRGFPFCLPKIQIGVPILAVLPTAELPCLWKNLCDAPGRRAGIHHGTFRRVTLWFTTFPNIGFYGRVDWNSSLQTSWHRATVALTLTRSDRKLLQVRDSRQTSRIPCDIITDDYTYAGLLDLKQYCSDTVTLQKRNLSRFSNIITPMLAFFTWSNVTLTQFYTDIRTPLQGIFNHFSNMITRMLVSSDWKNQAQTQPQRHLNTTTENLHSPWTIMTPVKAYSIWNIVTEPKLKAQDFAGAHVNDSRLDMDKHALCDSRSRQNDNR